MSPLCTQRWGHILYLCPLSLSQYFPPALSIVQVVKHETLTQSWTNVGPPSTTLAQHQPSIGLLCRFCRHAECGPASHSGGQTLTHFLFKASCWYCQLEVLTRAEWILPGSGESGPTFNRHWIGVSLYSVDTPQPTESSVQC